MVIFGISAATVVKNAIRVATIRNPNVALFANAEKPNTLVGETLNKLNYTPFIGLYPAYENEKFNETLFFTHFEMKVNQITNKSNLIPVVRTTELEDQLQNLTNETIFAPDIRLFHKIKAKKNNNELGISFKILRRSNSTAEHDTLANQILDGTRLRVGAWEKNFNAEKIQKRVTPVTIHRKTDDMIELDSKMCKTHTHNLRLNKIQIIFGYVHNPFVTNWEEYSYASKIYKIPDWRKSRTSCKKPFELKAKFNTAVLITNEIEYENYDLFMLLEALGGLLEIFFVVGGFIVTPINQRYFDNEYQRVFNQLLHLDELEIVKKLKIEDIFQMKQLLLVSVNKHLE